MHCQHRDHALRLFLRNIRDQEERYALISNFVQHDDLPYTVTFDFLKEGIKIHGEWLPALKMDWLSGETLDDYIVDNLANPAKLGELLSKFVTMMSELRRAGIAHGDLQHGNVLMCENELRLVDYDGMYVPSMNGYLANELGHRNYQHPDRAAHHFGNYLDNFSAWVIFASIRALQLDSRLLHQLGGGDDCLLFRQTDFTDPLHSAAFAALEKHENLEVKNLGRFIRVQLKNDLKNIPHLQFPVRHITDDELDPISQDAAVVKSGARLVRGNLPDWLQQANADVLANSNLSNADVIATKKPTTAPKMVPQSWAVAAKPRKPYVWHVPNTVPNTSQVIVQKPGNKIASVVNSINPQAPVSLPTPQLPAKLLVNTPRRIKWNESCGRISPHDLILLMCLNPAVWLMFLSGFWDATIYGPFFWMWFWAIINLCCLLKIFVTPLKHRNLAKFGQPAFARIEDLRSTTNNGKMLYQAQISFDLAGQHVSRWLSMPNSEYQKLFKGSTEIILHDGKEFGDVVLYRFCRYHPVPTATTPTHAVQPITQQKTITQQQTTIPPGHLAAPYRKKKP